MNKLKLLYVDGKKRFFLLSSAISTQANDLFTNISTEFARTNEKQSERLANSHRNVCSYAQIIAEKSISTEKSVSVYMFCLVWKNFQNQSYRKQIKNNRIVPHTFAERVIGVIKSISEHQHRHFLLLTLLLANDMRHSALNMSYLYRWNDAVYHYELINNKCSGSNDINDRAMVKFSPVFFFFNKF